MDSELRRIHENWQNYPALRDRAKCPICGIPTILHLAVNSIDWQIELERLTGEKIVSDTVRSSFKPRRVISRRKRKSQF